MTTGQPVRIGVIGGGFGIQHLQGFSATEDAEVVAFCQRTKDKAEATAKAFGVTHVYTDYRRLLGHPGLDAVSIVAPPHLHAEMVAAALDQGLHLLCEKPLAMDAAQAETMLSRAEAAGRVHMTAFNHRHIPALAYMKELLDGGYVGERVYHVESRWFSENRATPGLTHYWRHQRELAGFGVMGDIGVHVVDRIRWLVGEFESVWGHADTFIPERPDEDGTPQPVTVEDSFTLLGRLAVGASACVRLSAVARKSNYQNLEVYGDAGMLRFVFDRNVKGWVRGQLWGARGDTRSPEALEIPDRYTQGLDDSDPQRAQGEFIFAKLTRDFVDAIRNGTPAAPSFADGLAAQRVLDAALRAAEEGQRVHV